MQPLHLPLTPDVDRCRPKAKVRGLWQHVSVPPAWPPIPQRALARCGAPPGARSRRPGPLAAGSACPSQGGCARRPPLALSAARRDLRGPMPRTPCARVSQLRKGPRPAPYPSSRVPRARVADSAGRCSMQPLAYHHEGPGDGPEQGLRIRELQQSRKRSQCHPRQVVIYRAVFLIWLRLYFLIDDALHNCC